MTVDLDYCNNELGCHLDKLDALLLALISTVPAPQLLEDMTTESLPLTSTEARGPDASTPRTADDAGAAA